MKLRRVLLTTLLATLFIVARSQCPSQPTDSVSVVDSGQIFTFPNTGYFFVVDNLQQDWLLLMVERSLDVYQIEGPEPSFASLRGYLYTPGPDRLIYLFYAEGPHSPLSIRGSPDLKWVTLKNIQINGTSTTYTPPLVFNVTIPYADFWSDEPAKDIFASKDIYEVPNSECVNENFNSYGTNNLQSKSFPIYFDFTNGLHLEFIIPQGQPNAFYTAHSSQQLYKNCGC